MCVQPVTIVAKESYSLNIPFIIFFTPKLKQLSNYFVFNLRTT